MPGTYHGDFFGFTAFIESSGTFPLMIEEGLPIKQGYNNIFTLTSSKVEAMSNMRSQNSIDRNCLFPEEISKLKIKKTYSYLNCKFECFLLYTQTEIYRKYNVSCQPWFYPTFDDSPNVCDPFQSYDFYQIMSNHIPDNLCSHCLPDCGSTVYKARVIVQPFDMCDIKNKAMPSGNIFEVRCIFAKIRPETRN